MRVPKITKADLIDFENIVKFAWEKGEITRPVHLSGGNEDELLEIFKEIREDDYVFSTHRNHYHALLSGIRPLDLLNRIKESTGGSMCVISREKNFFSTAIVGGNLCIATGVALSAKLRNNGKQVFCFVGDGAVDQGHFYEAVRYSVGYDLPIKFIVEDNDRSVTTSVADRWGTCGVGDVTYGCSKIVHYTFTPTAPHVGSGKHVSF